VAERRFHVSHPWGLVLHQRGDFWFGVTTSRSSMVLSNEMAQALGPVPLLLYGRHPAALWPSDATLPSAKEPEWLPTPVRMLGIRAEMWLPVRGGPAFQLWGQYRPADLKYGGELVLVAEYRPKGWPA
jgi:hypothetical protein